jgi:DNA-binding transcriptional LysR family regulator
MKQDEHSHRDGAARSRHARSQALVAPSDANARRVERILPDPIPAINENDLRLFRIFRAVAEAGGLAAAEIKLGMDRSSISRQLSALETRLNARLCFRGPSGFELTEFGRQALRAAIHAQDTLEMIGHKLNEARTMMSGDLYIGIADNFLTNPRCALVQALSEFRRLAPNVTVHLSIHLPSELLGNLADRRLQLGITGTALGVVGTTLGNERLRCQPLFTETFRLYVASRDPLPPPSLDELESEGYELVVRDRDPHTRQLVERVGIARHGISVGLEAVATLIASGRFAGFLPTHYVGSLEPIYAYAPVRDAEELAYETAFSLVVVEDRQVAPSTQLFMRILEDVHASKHDNDNA